MVIKNKILIVLIILPLFMIISCQKKEANKEVKNETLKNMPHDTSGFNQQMDSHPVDRAKIPEGSRTVIPSNVKGKWSSVKIIFEDKKANSKKEYVVKIGDNFSIPEASLMINVIDFLPDLKIEDDPNGSVFTSISNDPNNPAIHIKVVEKDKEIFNGWIFSLFPSVHPFEHEKYGIYLKEGIA